MWWSSWCKVGWRRLKLSNNGTRIECPGWSSRCALCWWLPWIVQGYGGGLGRDHPVVCQEQGMILHCLPKPNQWCGPLWFLLCQCGLLGTRRASGWLVAICIKFIHYCVNILEYEVFEGPLSSACCPRVWSLAEHSCAECLVELSQHLGVVPCLVIKLRVSQSIVNCCGNVGGEEGMSA
jgi:hypothetical protein